MKKKSFRLHIPTLLLLAAGGPVKLPMSAAKTGAISFEGDYVVLIHRNEVGERQVNAVDADVRTAMKLSNGKFLVTVASSFPTELTADQIKFVGLLLKIWDVEVVAADVAATDFVATWEVSADGEIEKIAVAYHNVDGENIVDIAKLGDSTVIALDTSGFLYYYSVDAGQFGAPILTPAETGNATTIARPFKDNRGKYVVVLNNPDGQIAFNADIDPSGQVVMTLILADKSADVAKFELYAISGGQATIKDDSGFRNVPVPGYFNAA